MLGGIIEDVNERADIGIKSPLKEAGGLPVLDSEAPDIEGDNEYARRSLEIDGTLSGADRRPW
jgi:hypothetical protein